MSSKFYISSQKNIPVQTSLNKRINREIYSVYLNSINLCIVVEVDMPLAGQFHNSASSGGVVELLFVSQTFVDTDAGGTAGRNPTGDDRKHNHDSKPDPDAVRGWVIFSGKIDDFSQGHDKHRSDTETNGQRKEPTGKAKHQALAGEHKADVS